MIKIHHMIDLTPVFDKAAYRQLGWISNGDIKNKILAEIRRGTNTGQPLTFIRMKLISEKTGIKAKTGLSMNRLCDLISRNTRKYDLKFILDESTIGVLLLDTPLAGATAYRDRIDALLNPDSVSRLALIHIFALEDIYEKIVSAENVWGVAG